MPLDFTNINEALFSTNPALWRCPIQYGIPYMLELVRNWIILIAALVLLFGIILSAYKHMITFGDPEKAKQARLTLIWTVGGALVVILASFLIYGVAGYFIADGEPLDFKKIKLKAECKPPAKES